MTLASRVNNAQSAIRSARLNLDQLPALGAVEFQDWASTYDELQPVIVKALSSAHGKVCTSPLVPASLLFSSLYIGCLGSGTAG